MSPRPRSDDDNEWIARAAAGDADAVDQLCRREHASVYRLCFGFLLDRQLAEDAAQEALLLLIDRLASYDPGRPFATWRNTVVANLCRDRLRHASTRQRAEKTAASAAQSFDSGSPCDAAANSELQEILRASLAVLSPRERAVFMLHDLEMQDSAQVADALAITTGTVRSLLCLARRRLKTFLSERLLRARD
jgi:RNA polymerase sigma-70 factor (ECF subfamily)